MRSPLQQSAAALREQIVDFYTVPLVDANFPDGGGDCGAIQLRQLPDASNFFTQGKDSGSSCTESRSLSSWGLAAPAPVRHNQRGSGGSPPWR